LLFAPSASAINFTINYDAGKSASPNFDSNGAGLSRLVDFAAVFYEDVFENAQSITINYWYEELSGNPLGRTTWSPDTTGSPPIVADLRIDPSHDWFIDPTPADNSEFDMGQILWQDLSTNKRADYFSTQSPDVPDTFEVGYSGVFYNEDLLDLNDMLSLVLHEMGHAILRSAPDGDDDFDFDPDFIFGESLAAKAVSIGGTHLEATDALMNPGLLVGSRTLPSHTDLFAMASTNDYTILDVPRREFYGGSDWNTNANWSGNRRPGSGDDAFVRNPGTIVTVNLSGSAFASELQVSEGATVSTHDHKLDVTNAIKILDPNSRIIVDAGGELEASNIVVDNEGTLEVSGRGQVNGDIAVDQNGLIIVDTGVLRAEGDVRIGSSSFSHGTLAVQCLSLLDVEGTLTIEGSTSRLKLDGGTLRIAAMQNGSGWIELDAGGGGGTIDVSTEGTIVQVPYRIGGTGQLMMTGDGALRLTNHANDYGGDTTILGRKLELGDDEVIPDSSAVIVGGGSQLDLNSFNETIGSLAGSGEVTIAGGSLTTGPSNFTTTFSGVVNGSGELVKVGAGKLHLTGSNSYSGHTTVSGGVLSGDTIANSGDSSSFGTGSSFDLADGATLEYTGSADGSTNRTLTIGPGEGTIEANFGNLQFTGIINGLGGLKKVGHRALKLTYSGNSYAGPTTVSAGKLETGANEVIPDGSAVSVASGAQLDLNTFTETIGSLAVAAGGEVTLAAGATLNTNDTIASSVLEGLLAVQLAGPSESQYGKMQVDGDLLLSGSLSLALAGGFNPQPGNMFDILDWGTFAGTFSSLQLPSLADGFQWITSQLYTSGVLSVALAGDFDNDGDVDGRDFLAWQRNPQLGSLADWQDNYGAGALDSALRLPPSALNVAVPEPSCLALLLGLMFLTGRVRAEES
jgi:autotransporter-associated beta strand protein